LFKIAILLVIIKIANCRQVCYVEAGYDYGCFTNEIPFGGTLQRPVSLLPDTPSRIASRFTTYNRENLSGKVIGFQNFASAFNPNLNTKMIIHGFLHHDNHVWVQNMKDSILRYENVNVITVDWSKGNGLPYTQATANTQVVGREIAKLINSICDQTETRAENFHLIGHSLGSHISGYAGERLKNFYKKNLGRITGLDPAGPYFENTDPIVRLDPTDANFVDIIHSDGRASLHLGMGLAQRIGHVDFYPNGGFDQPNCPQTSDKLLSAIFNLVTLDYEQGEATVACSHNAAIYYFTDSIENKCKYTAYSCNSKENFDSGLCLECFEKNCNRMGYWAAPDMERGMLYLNTQTGELDKPYCLQNYLVNLYSHSKDSGLSKKSLFLLK